MSKNKEIAPHNNNLSLPKERPRQIQNKESEVIFTNKEFKIQLEGTTFVIFDSGKEMFYSRNKNGHQGFMSKKVVEKILNHSLSVLSSRAKTNEEKQELKEAHEEIKKIYESADKERQKLTIIYDENGNISRITKRDGYDEHEKITIFLSAHGGYASRRRYSDELNGTTINTRETILRKEASGIIDNSLTKNEKDRDRIQDWWGKAKTEAEIKAKL